MGDEKEKTDGKVKVKVLRTYAADGIMVKHNPDKPDEVHEITVDCAKRALRDHPVDPPIEIVGGLSKEEAKEIEDFCADYRKKWKAARNEGKHHSTPAQS